MVRLFHQELGGLFRRCYHSEHNGPRLRTVGGDTPKDRWRESLRERTGYDERGVPICNSSRPNPHESRWPHRTPNGAPTQNPSAKFGAIPANPRDNPPIRRSNGGSATVK